MDFRMFRFSLRSQCFTLLALTTAVLAAGCTKGTPGLVQVTGKMTVDGKPAEGASLVFFPDGADDPSKIAAGTVDSTGQYKLVTNLEPGIHPGKYKVTATWPDRPKDSKRGFSMSNAEDPPDLLKGRYSSPMKTKLTAEVNADTKEMAPIELSTK